MLFRGKLSPLCRDYLTFLGWFYTFGVEIQSLWPHKKFPKKERKIHYFGLLLEINTARQCSAFPKENIYTFPVFLLGLFVAERARIASFHSAHNDVKKTKGNGKVVFHCPCVGIMVPTRKDFYAAMRLRLSFVVFFAFLTQHSHCFSPSFSCSVQSLQLSVVLLGEEDQWPI
jgi:hypothetical protein